MAVTVKVPRMMRDRVGGQPTVEGTGDTIAALLEDLEDRYPGLSSAIVTETGDLHRFVNLYLNGEDVRFLKSLHTQVKDGDTISVLPAVAGGVVSRHGTP